MGNFGGRKTAMWHLLTILPFLHAQDGKQCHLVTYMIGFVTVKKMGHFGAKWGHFRAKVEGYIWPSFRKFCLAHIAVHAVSDIICASVRVHEPEM